MPSKNTPPVIPFPGSSGPLSEEEMQKIRDQAIGYAGILNSRLDRISADRPLDLNEPLEYTLGDFYLLAQTLLLTRIELDERIAAIVRHLNGDVQ